MKFYFAGMALEGLNVQSICLCIEASNEDEAEGIGMRAMRHLYSTYERHLLTRFGGYVLTKDNVKEQLLLPV